MLEIRLLGQLEVRDGEHVIDVRRKKQRALLAALALRAGDVVSPDRLVDDLWGEAAPKTARHALENYVSELRKALGHEVIRTGSAGYAIEIGRDQVDATRFERLVAEAHDAPATARADTYRAALSLVRGPPLDDLAYEPFAQAAVPRLQELELAAREGLAEAELELGMHTNVVLALEPLVVAYPYRERLRALLMLALYRAGRQAEALAAYQDGRRILVEELGIDPGDDLQELERAILRQDSTLRAPARIPVTVASASPTHTPTLHAARKTVSVLVAELTNLAELARLLDPEPLRAVLDRYHAVGAAAVERHGGTSRRLDGEALLAVFGFPATREDDALRAVRAAVHLRDGVGELNDGLFSESGAFLAVREAVTSGPVLVTPQDAEIATGSSVTDARELARAARAGQILVDAAARALLKDTIVAEVEAVEAGPDTRAFRVVELRPDAHGRVLRLDSPLVGRRRQLARLSSALETVVAERTLQLLTVLGEAGVGKSRLVREFTDGVESLASVIRCSCQPYGERDPYRPLTEALGLADEATGSPQRDLIRGALERLALEGPLVLVVEDLHWADPSLLELVAEIADLSRGVPVLVLCIARPELLEGAPSWGGGQPNASSFLLEPLTETESDRLIDNLLGESELPDALRDHVIRIADGNPLFVEEMLATLVDQKVLTRRAGRWTTTSTAAVPVPATIQALIAARIDRLRRGDRLVLELASLERTQTFSRVLITELAPDEMREEVPAHLDSLVRKELVRPEPGDPDRFAFRHELVREAAYSSMPMARRAELHERLAALIDDSSAADETKGPAAARHRTEAQRYRDFLGATTPEPPGSR